MTYGELRQKVAGLAEELRLQGHRPGDRIGIISENNPFFVCAYVGVIQAGLVAVPFQTEITQVTFEQIVTSTEIKEVLASRRMAGRIEPWCKGLQCTVEKAEGKTQKGECDSVTAAGEPSSNPLIDESTTPRSPLAALMFTSGSTGEPKGVMVTHRNIECNTRDIISYLGLTPADRVMVVLPFHYCFGLSLLHTHLMAGGSVVLNNDFRLYPETVLREMQQKECTGLAGVPSTYQILLRKSRFRQMSFPQLRWFQQAGGKLPNPCIQEIRSSFPQVAYYLMYGQTEATARLSYLPPERLEDKLGSIGRGLPSTRLQVLRPDGTAVTRKSEGRNPPAKRDEKNPKLEIRTALSPSALAQSINLSGAPVASLRSSAFEDEEVGEIVAEGDNISPGYWKDPEETARYFRDGKLYTGDLARVDEDGFIYIVERERDMIKSGGNRVSAKEIEDVIAELAEVVEVAVVGAPHELLGESIQAFVVLVPKATLQPKDIQSHCRKRLPAFKAPEEVIFLKAMPHNSAGKVLKKQLKGGLPVRAG